MCVILYRLVHMYMLMYIGNDDIIVYKSGGVIGVFWCFIPLGKGRKFSNLFGDFGGKIGGLNWIFL